ncbi:MAG: thioredoxin family protein [Campylobacterales bacterium]|nr:thioredoxin family protein [Campylobacterales bacterium]
MKQFGFLLICSVSLSWAQSPFVLTGVKQYAPVISIETDKVDPKIKSEILESMGETSKELGITTKSDSPRALAFIIKRISVGDTIALKMDLVMGENLQRAEDKEQIFVLSYMDTHIFVPEEMEDDVMDNADEMLETFARQYEEDNAKNLPKSQGISRESFVQTMQYETAYQTALIKAKKVNKPLMVFMTMNYCPWCRKLESQVLSKPSVDEDVKRYFVPLMLNFSEKKFPEFLNEIAMTPTLYVIDPKTEKIEQSFVGYNNHEDFLQFLKKIKSNDQKGKK